MPSAVITEVPKAWGREVWIANRAFCGKILRLNEGARCSLHMHPVKDETFYVLSGRVRVELGEPRAGVESRRPLRVIDLRPGEAVDIPPRTLHRFFGLQASEIAEFSTHHDDADTIRLEVSQGAPA